MSLNRITETKCLEELFKNWDETLIWSCLQGYMGSAWAEDVLEPKSAQLVVGDFCFLAGIPNVELVTNKPKERQSDFIIMIPQTVEWGELIERTYSERAKKVTRYAIKKEPGVFDRKKLKEFTDNIREPYKLQLIDSNLFDQAVMQPWSRDLCSQFKDYNDYQARGVGAAVTDNGILVSGASSYTVYREGIEIEIDTREDYRRQGLALACGARLILECMDRGLYPSWDAQNKWSVALAEKLGYHFDKEYTAYEINGY
jgi:GNAT superfamily N-acetyltransferase